MQAVDPDQRFAKSQIEAVMVILSIITALFVILRYGMFETIVAVGLMIGAILAVLSRSEALDRSRWTWICVALAALWIVCVPMHAIFVSLVD